MRFHNIFIIYVISLIVVALTFAVSSSAIPINVAALAPELPPSRLLDQTVPLEGVNITPLEGVNTVPLEGVQSVPLEGVHTKPLDGVNTAPLEGVIRVYHKPTYQRRARAHP